MTQMILSNEMLFLNKHRLSFKQRQEIFTPCTCIEVHCIKSTCTKPCYLITLNEGAVIKCSVIVTLIPTHDNYILSRTAEEIKILKVEHILYNKVLKLEVMDR